MAGLVGGAWDTVAGGLDWAAGNTDESFHQLVENAQEGGDVDETLDIVAGSTDEFVGRVTSENVLWAVSPLAAFQNENVQEAAGDAADPVLDGIGNAAEAGEDAWNEATPDSPWSAFINAGPWLQVGAILVAAYLLGQLFDVEVGDRAA